MAKMPKTVVGKLFMVAVVIAAVPVLLWFAIMLSGPIVWAGLVAITVTTIVLYIRRRREDAARARAWVGTFSFAEVVQRKRAEATLERPTS